MKQIALVTGATAGIGKAIALELSQNNYDLIITGRREERLLSLSEELKIAGAKVYCSVFDVRDADEVEKAIDTLPEEWKNIAVLVNNAGLAAGLSPTQTGDIADWNQMIDTNVKGLLFVSRKVLPLMIERGSGHIVNISSIAGKEVYPAGNVYCASKHAVEAITKGMLKNGIL